MEFKDRVANKPNRVKLTYEDSNTSVYATVELADEPIEEGTPLNAFNMNKLLNKEDDNYIVASGFASSLGAATQIYFEKYSNGIIKVYTQIRCETVPNTPIAAGLFALSDVGMLNNSLICCTASVNASSADGMASLRLTADYVRYPEKYPDRITAVVQNLENENLPEGNTYIANLMFVGKWK